MTAGQAGMFLIGLLLCVAGGSGVLWFGLFGLLSASGAIAGLLAPDRIPEERRRENAELLKALAVKVVTGLIACGVGAGLIAASEGTPLEAAQEAADAATKDGSRPDAQALTAAADACAFQLFGRVKEPIAKKTKDGWVVAVSLRLKPDHDAATDAAALALCVHRAGRERNLLAVLVGSPDGAWKLTRSALSQVESWEEPTDAASTQAAAVLEVVEREPRAPKRVDAAPPLSPRKVTSAK